MDFLIKGLTSLIANPLNQAGETIVDITRNNIEIFLLLESDISPWLYYSCLRRSCITEAKAEV